MGSVKHFYRLAVCAALIALTAAETRAAETKYAATEKNISNFPNAAALQRLARRAITNATGLRMKTGPVTLKEKLSDGSFLVDVMLENGRKVKGRLYRDRLRYKIAIDRKDFYSTEKTIIIKKEQ
jgi:hypothetical protein